MIPAILKKWIAGIIFLLFAHNCFAQEISGLKFKRSRCYAGIEIGSKGVKWTVLEIGAGGKETGAFQVLQDSSINTDFLEFNEASFRETLEAALLFHEISTEKYKLPSSGIFTVFSSGVQAAAQKDGQLAHVKALADSFRSRTHDSNRSFLAVDVAEEARLSHVGMIPAGSRYTSFLIDIGSGNTKGGYFPNGNTTDFKLFQLPWGTKRLCHSIENRLGDDATLLNFKKQLARVCNGPLEEEIAYAVNSSGGYDLSDQIVFSGGVVWALSNLMFPRLVENTVVPVSFNELKEFCIRLAEDPAACNSRRILQQYGNQVADKFQLEKELNKIENVFNRRDLLAGAHLLLGIMRQFESTFSTKQFYMIKQGQVGWISAYVDASVMHIGSKTKD